MKKITLFIFTLFVMHGLQAQDTCASAVAVSTGKTTVGNIDGTEVPQPVCALNGDVPAGNNPAGEWYSYTPSQDEVVTITTTSPQNDGGVNSDDTRVHTCTAS